MMRWAEREARDRGLERVTVGVRLALVRNLSFYRALGYHEVARHAHPGYDEPTWVSLEKRL